MEQPSLADLAPLGPDYRRGIELALAFRRSSAELAGGAVVWQIRPDRTINLTRAGDGMEVGADHVLIATGAMERPFPIPGWTLPGVMTAGAAQTLMKSAGLVAEDGVVLAGCGPLLFQLASQYLQAGVRPGAIVETTPRGNYWRAASGLPMAWASEGYLKKGLALLRAIKASGVPFHRRAQNLRVLGETRADALEFESGGKTRWIETPLLLLHQGVVPNANLAMATGITHNWDPVQLCWRPETGHWGGTNREGIAVAGDGAGIGGAVAAEHGGRLAALEIARRLGRITAEERDERATVERAALRRHLRARPFLDSLYRPPDALRRPADDTTLACRCEEVTAGEIRRQAELGLTDLNALKSQSRCGMGPCQGRLCALTAVELLAETHRVDPADIGPLRIRPPARPVDLTAIMAFDDGTIPPEAALPKETAAPGAKA
ncbi:MAG: FAD-dependent oxidoreductase [Rhodospirillaceae bacterium]|nr:FAD-dependent oxidoreductase [Rhodospirillaceae bacterium]